MYSKQSKAQKGRLQTLSFGSQTSQIWPKPKRDTATETFTLVVLFLCPFMALIIISHWRGLLALPILWV